MLDTFFHRVGQRLEQRIRRHFHQPGVMGQASPVHIMNSHIYLVSSRVGGQAGSCGFHAGNQFFPQSGLDRSSLPIHE